MGSGDKEFYEQHQFYRLAALRSDLSCCSRNARKRQTESEYLRSEKRLFS